MIYNYIHVRYHKTFFSNVPGTQHCKCVKLFIKKYRRFNSSINQIRFQPIVRVIWSQDGQINPPPLCNIEDRVLRLPTPTAITFVLGNFEILFQKSMPCGKGRECILHLGVRMAVYKLSVCKLSQVMLYRVTQVEIKFLQQISSRVRNTRTSRLEDADAYGNFECCVYICTKKTPVTLYLRMIFTYLIIFVFKILDTARNQS